MHKEPQLARLDFILVTRNSLRVAADLLEQHEVLRAEVADGSNQTVERHDE